VATRVCNHFKAGDYPTRLDYGLLSLLSVLMGQDGVSHLVLDLTLAQKQFGKERIAMKSFVDKH